MDDKRINNRGIRARLTFLSGQLHTCKQILVSMDNLSKNTFKNALAGKSEKECLELLSADLGAIHEGIRNLAAGAQEEMTANVHIEYPRLIGLEFGLNYQPGKNPTDEPTITVQNIQAPKVDSANDGPDSE